MFLEVRKHIGILAFAVYAVPHLTIFRVRTPKIFLIILRSNFNSRLPCVHKNHYDMRRTWRKDAWKLSFSICRFILCNVAQYKLCILIERNIEMYEERIISSFVCRKITSLCREILTPLPSFVMLTVMFTLPYFLSSQYAKILRRYTRLFQLYFSLPFLQVGSLNRLINQSFAISLGIGTLGVGVLVSLPLNEVDRLPPIFGQKGSIYG